MSRIVNDKGTILPVTIVAMTIMMIIGIICLKIFSSQNILDTYDQAKIRTTYSAEGVVEVMRGYIQYAVNVNKDPMYGDNHHSGRGYINWKTSAGNWTPLNNATEYPVLAADFFDGTMYPGIKVSAYCSRLSAADFNLLSSEYPAVNATSYGNYNAGENCAYKIVAIASTTHKTNLATQLIVSTVTYYFATKRTVIPIINYINRQNYFICWRKD